MRYKRIFLHVVGAVAAFYTFNLLLMDIILTRANEKKKLTVKMFDVDVLSFPCAIILHRLSKQIQELEALTFTKKKRKNLNR